MCLICGCTREEKVSSVQILTKYQSSSGKYGSMRREMMLRKSLESYILICSMFGVIQKKEHFNEVFLNYFKENKVEIAHAITKLFPFLESLRDRSFITDKIYADSYEACGNSIPVEKVVYNVLSHLEKLPDPSFLWVLFNRVNLKEYPALREIYKSLETGTNLHTHENWATENLQEPETPQNQVDEIIAISSESSECSEEK
ncbi:sp110 nuclear body protein isoform X2 [Rattus norvegicus]|uniref:sp110 nuclear body protein isoform X2 n=1 Tax=Rattus norvegicus TaxID=10116 RepID=UPI0025464448|nr:sp110 nuclear body protein isoform X2 [Rattus norvegicus]